MMPEKHHDDESWLVSYADMITLLLGFFVILFSFSTVDTAKLSKVSDHITDALGKDPNVDSTASEQNRQEIAEKEARQQKALQELSKLLNMGSVTEFVSSMEKGKSRAEAVAAAKDLIGEGSGVDKSIMEIVIPDDTLFQKGQARINDESIKGLRKVADKIKQIQGDIEVLVSGHSDSSPKRNTGLYPSNWALSAVRASAVAKVLVDYGVKPQLLKPTGLSDTQPLFSERRADGSFIPENMRKNRRVEIVIKFKE